MKIYVLFNNNDIWKKIPTRLKISSSVIREGIVLEPSLVRHCYFQTIYADDESSAKQHHQLRSLTYFLAFTEPID